MTSAAVPRRQQAEERREQILDAAIRVFSQKGYGGASIRDISREVGVTEGLLYHYFESKEHLMTACWKERGWRAHLERILAESDGVPLEQVLRDLISNFLQTLRENGPMVRMCAIESQRSPEMLAWHLQRIGDNQQLMAGFFRSRVETGEIRPDADMATAAGLLMGCAYAMFLLLGDSEPEIWNRAAENHVQNGVDIVMRGVAP